MAYNLPDESDGTNSEMYSFPKGLSEIIQGYTNKLQGKIFTDVSITNVFLSSS